MKKVIELPENTESYIILHRNADGVSVLADKYDGDLTSDTLAETFALGLVGIAGMMADNEESIMEVNIKLLNYFLLVGADRWGDKFRDAVEMHRLKECAE